jgi:hypothetical protein
MVEMETETTLSHSPFPFLLPMRSAWHQLDARRALGALHFRPRLLGQLVVDQIAHCEQIFIVYGIDAEVGEGLFSAASESYCPAGRISRERGGVG